MFCPRRGNCGVGFAPCRTDEDSRTFLLNLVEAVEDIPNEALSVGIDWAWETFPEWVHSPLLIPPPSISRLPSALNRPLRTGTSTSWTR